MPEIKNTFISGKMNKDLDERVVANGEYRDAMNIQVSTSEGSSVGAIQNILGNEIVAGQGVIPSNSFCVGSINDEKDNSIYWLVAGGNSNLAFSQIYSALNSGSDALVYKDLILKHGVDDISNLATLVFIDIYKVQALHIATLVAPGVGANVISTATPVHSVTKGMVMKFVDKSTGLYVPGFAARVQSIDATGMTITLDRDIDTSLIIVNGYLEFYNDRVLDFDRTRLITGINIIDDFLFWTDNYSEPKKINIKRSIEGTNLNGQQHTNLIVTDRDITNSNNITPIRLEHVTVVKKYPLTPPVLDLTGIQDELSGTVSHYFYNSITGNAQEVGNTWFGDFSTLNLNVNDVLILNPTNAGTSLPFAHEVRVRVVRDMTFVDPSGLILASGWWEVEILSILSNVNVTTTWDWMIQVTEDEKIFQRRFPRFAYRYKYEDGEYSTFSPFSEIAFKPGVFQYEPKQAYNLGLQNTLTRVVIKDFNTSQIPKEVVQIDILYKETNSPTVYVVDKLKKIDPPLDSGFNNWDLNEYEITSDVIYSVLPENQLLRSWDNVPRLALAQEITANRLIYGNYLQNYTLKHFNAAGDYEGPELKPSPVANWESEVHGWNYYGEKSVKTNREYNLGITYLDVYGRETPVFTNKDASIKMPFAQSHRNNRLNIKNRVTPPSWAKYWKVYVKETSNEYYNLVMDRVYRAKDGNVWLSFPSSDRNKVDEETFLILKKTSDSDTPVVDPNKYKIIALENEAPDFIKTKRVWLGESSGKPDTVITNTTIIDPATGNNILVPCAELFDEPDFIPGLDVFKLRINKAIWTSYHELPLDDIKEKLSLTFFMNSPTGGLIYSEDYDVADFTLVEGSTASTVTHYNIVLEKAINEDWIQVNPNANWNQLASGSTYVGCPATPCDSNEILEPTLGLRVYKYKIENKPEFDGRFFAKIYSDNLIDDTIAPLISVQNVETIIAQMSVNYLSDSNVPGVGNGTTGNSISDTHDKWRDNVRFSATPSTATNQSKWFIDQTFHKGTVDNSLNGSILDPEQSDYWRDGFGSVAANGGCESSTAPYLHTCDDSIYHKNGIYEENGQWYIDLSFSQIKPELHDGDPNEQAIKDILSNAGDNEDEMAMYQGLVSATDGGLSLFEKFGIGTSANPEHEDERAVVDLLSTEGSQFRFSGDASGTIYTITAPPDITYHLNHNTIIQLDKIYVELYVEFGGNGCNTIPCMTGQCPAWGPFKDVLKHMGDPHNRRTTYKIPIDKNPNDYWNPIGNGVDLDTSTNIQFMGYYSEDTVNQLQSSNPAIWETEPKENVDLDIYYEASQAYPVKLNIDNNTQYIPIGSTFKFESPTSGNIWYEVVSFDNNIITFDFLTRQFDANGLPILPNSLIPDGEELTFNSPYTGTVSAIVLNPNSDYGDTITISNYVALQSVTLGWTNCYSFGNGVESDRVRDDFNQVTIDNGAVASSTIEEPYEEERRKYGLIYSGLYNSISGVNNLNQFIQAEKITKDLNPDNSSIQKLHTRNTDLVVLCEDKVLRMLANKDAVYNADGNMQLTATNNVLGQAVPFVGEFGISKNPESFAFESYRSYFTDKQRGAVMRLSKDGLTPISMHGMKDWFRDNLKLSNKLVGSYDDRNDEYNITLDGTTDEPVTVSFKEDVRGWVSFKSFVPENAISCANDYFTILDGKLYKHYVEILDPVTGEDTNRNTFYAPIRPRIASHVEVLLNESPGFIKSFNILNYEGSQSRVDQFTSATIGGVSYEDGQYHNLGSDKKGWYVEKILTDKQDGSLDEFIEKEGKWFNYIRGNELPTNASGAIIGGFDYDPSEFSWQGIGTAITANAAPILGCTDPQFLQYDPLATQDDGSCLIPHVYGCMSGAPCADTITTDCTSNFDCKPGNFPAPGQYGCYHGVTIDDGSCVILGCTQSTALNYFPTATTGNSQMNNCVATVYGCTDSTGQFNYDATANVPCSATSGYNPFGCFPPNCNGPGNDECCKPYIFGCTDSTMFNYNPIANTLDPYNPCIPFIYGCTDPNANNQIPNANTDDGSCTYDTHTATFSINALYQLVLEIIPNTNALPGGQFVAEIFDPSGTFVAGQQSYISVFSIQQFIVPCATVVNGNYTAEVTFAWPNLIPSFYYTYNFSQSAIPGCTFQSINSQSTTNYDPNATVDDCSCVTCVYGCTDNDGSQSPGGTSCTIIPTNYDPLATCNNSTCIYLGCTDPMASNYTGCATQDDGSCLFAGCTDTSSGCFPDITGHCPGNNSTGNTVGQPSCNPGEGYKFDNHDPTATVPCCTLCDGTDDNNCCKGEINGCMTTGSFNYISCATSNTFNVDCIPTVTGCIDANSINHGSYALGSATGDYSANTNFGLSAPLGPTGNLATWVYNQTGNPGPNNDISGYYGPNTHDASACVIAPQPSSGCTDPTALNYNPNATIDDGSCCYSGGCVMPNYFDVTPSAQQLTSSSNLTHPGCVDYYNGVPGSVVDDCYGDLINVGGINISGNSSGTSTSAGITPQNNGVQVGNTMPVALNGGNQCADHNCDLGVVGPSFHLLTNQNGWLDPFNVVPNPLNISSLTTNWTNWPYANSFVSSGTHLAEDCCIYQDGCKDSCADNFNPAATGLNDAILCEYSYGTNYNWCNATLNPNNIHSSSNTVTGGYAPWHSIHNCCATGCGC